ncbi:IPT/TIG domain-containing protein [Xanthomonas sp. LMG 12459]|uniref:IPT/TIG domain-containing protein n=1 Tax=Xanthomonas sp. LMG 12459 TaxID=1591131 RepID=UPI001263397D|nr:IPT/TIG domain-containing protein [Xanthomonas sp. LMG 12459]KAB7779206.1 glutamate synthase [Xanthomonas sp. LMG 12459]
MERRGAGMGSVVGLLKRAAHVHARGWRRIVGRTVAASLLTLLACTSGATSYVYDAQGRLVAVSNDAGASARYRYDTMGNIVAVERVSSGTLAVLGFSPGRGAAGDRVLIQGQGFSTAASSNSVAFNGQAATVVAASARELTVLVPANASTGPISVTVAGQSASSAQQFVVDANLRQPTITGISPLIASAGTAITVDGQNLVPVAGQTTAKLDRKTAVLSSATGTRLVFPVPGRSGSGPVTVTTPYGSATSSQDVLVVPSSVSSVGIASVTRLTLDAAAVDVAVANAGGSAAVLFTGMAGDYLSAQFQSLGSTTLNYLVFGTDNVEIASGLVNANQPTLHLPRLKVGGTYLLLLTPSTSSASWKMGVEHAGRLALDGAETSVATSIAAQSKRYTFLAQAGSRLGLALTEQSPVGSGWGTALAQVFDADGVNLGYQYCNQANNGCALNIAAPRTGVYQVLLTPGTSGARTMRLNLLLSSDLVQALPKDQDVVVETQRRGQNLRLSFEAAAGEAFALQVAGQTTAPAGRDVYYRVYAPDGTSVASMAVRAAGTTYVTAKTSGTYQVLVDPGFGETVRLQTRLSTGDAGGGGSGIDGATGAFATQLPGDSVYFTFTATAGQSLGLGISELQSNESGPLNVTIYGPSGTPMAGAACEVANDGCDVNLPELAAGRYGVLVAPATTTQTMRFKATLSTDLALSLTRDAVSQVGIGRRGQNAVLSFQAGAGDALALQVSEQTTTPANGVVYYRVYRPDGTALSSMAVSGSGTLTMNTPIAGTYRLFVDPRYGATVAAKVLVTTGSAGGLQLDGSSGEYSAAAGQSVFFSFSAAASQNLGLGIGDLNLSSGTYVNVKIANPNGSTLTTATCYAANGCAFNLLNLAAGNYGVTVSPQSGSQSMAFKATLSTEVAGFLQRDALSSVNISRYAQNARLTFAGTAGESLALLVADAATRPTGRDVVYAVYRPNGALWKDVTASGNVILALPNLPETGSYRVFVDPVGGALWSARLKLSTGQDGNVELDGAGGSYQAPAGQGVHFSIDTQAGQNLGLGITDIAVSSGSYFNIAVYSPNGTTLYSGICYAEDGCSLPLRNTLAGRYSVVATPTSASQAIKFRAVLSSELLDQLTRDQPLHLALARYGQNARLRFQAQAGESLMLLVAAQTTLPAGRDVVYRVLRPDGAAWKAATIKVGDAINLINIPTSGEYAIQVESRTGSPLEADIILSSGVALPIDGAPAHVVTRLPAQYKHFSFVASQGQNLGLGISGIQVVGPGAQRVVATLYKADGSTLASSYCDVERGGCDFDLANLAAGKYALLIGQGDDQAATYDVTLSSDLPLNLQRDTPLAVSVARRGQNARLRFQGQAGDKLAVLVQEQTTAPADGTSYYLVYQPNGTLLTSGSTRTGTVIGLGSLPTTGQYSIVVDPQYGQTVDTTVTLSTGTPVAVDGSRSFAAGTPGAGIYFWFDAQAGQKLDLGLNQIALSGSGFGWVYVTLYRPDGSKVVSNTNCFRTYGCGFSIDAAQAGRYGVVVVPSTEDQSFSLTASVSSTVVGTLAWDVPQSIALDRHGKTATLSFSGTAGQGVLMRVVNQTTSPVGRPVTYALYRPDGQFYRSFSASTGSSDLSFPALPTSGTYRLRIVPEDGVTAAMDITLDSTP